MTRYVIILPSIYPPYTDECLFSMSDDVRSNVLVRDNTRENIGVSRSWNLGVRHMRETGADWLILLSAAIRFRQGGDDLIAQLDTPGMDVLEAMPVFGWHLIAFHRRVFDKVGMFDENFFNYFSDIDWSLRIQKTMPRSDIGIWNKISVAVGDRGMAHGVKLTGLDDPAHAPIEYFKRKWGRHPGASEESTHALPFNDSANDLTYWPPV